MEGGLKKYNNGRRHSPATKQKAQSLRSKGRTHREIAKQLHISSSTAHLWTKGIRLTNSQKQAIHFRRVQSFRKNWHISKIERQNIGNRLGAINKKHTKQSLIEGIKKFYRKNNRIPLKRELPTNTACRVYFGSWNKAIVAAGFQPNPEYFTKRTCANDGHMCDSTIERLVDDWLFRHGIPHERNRYYPDSKMTADFYIRKCEVWIELFGLKGAHKNYDRKHKRKLDIAHRKKLNFIALYTTDVLNKNLVTKLGSLIHDRT